MSTYIWGASATDISTVYLCVGTDYCLDILDDARSWKPRQDRLGILTKSAGKDPSGADLY